MTTTTPGGMPDLDLTAPLITDDDVLHRVDCLLRQECGGYRSLWLLFLSEVGVQLPVVVPIDDVPERPEPQDAGSLCSIIAEVIDGAVPGASAVLALTRPGAGKLSDADRSWFRSLTRAAEDHRAPIRMMCLATPTGVRMVTPSDIRTKAQPGRE